MRLSILGMAISAISLAQALEFKLYVPSDNEKYLTVEDTGVSLVEGDRSSFTFDGTNLLFENSYIDSLTEGNLLVVVTDVDNVIGRWTYVDGVFKYKGESDKLLCVDDFDTLTLENQCSGSEAEFSTDAEYEIVANVDGVLHFLNSVNGEVVLAKGNRKTYNFKGTNAGLVKSTEDNKLVVGDSEADDWVLDVQGNILEHNEGLFVCSDSLNVIVGGLASGCETVEFTVREIQGAVEPSDPKYVKFAYTKQGDEEVDVEKRDEEVVSVFLYVDETGLKVEQYEGSQFQHDSKEARLFIGGQSVDLGETGLVLKDSAFEDGEWTLDGNVLTFAPLGQIAPNLYICEDKISNANTGGCFSVDSIVLQDEGPEPKQTTTTGDSEKTTTGDSEKTTTGDSEKTTTGDSETTTTGDSEKTTTGDSETTTTGDSEKTTTGDSETTEEPQPTGSVDPSEPFTLSVILPAGAPPHFFQLNDEGEVIVAPGAPASFLIGENGELVSGERYVQIRNDGRLITTDDPELAATVWSIIDGQLDLTDPIKRELVDFTICMNEGQGEVYINDGVGDRCASFQVVAANIEDPEPQPTGTEDPEETETTDPEETETVDPEESTESEETLYTTVTTDVTITVTECDEDDICSTITKTTIETYCPPTTTEDDFCETITITTCIENSCTEITSTIDRHPEDKKTVTPPGPAPNPLTEYDNGANNVFVKGTVGMIAVILPLFM